MRKLATSLATVSGRSSAVPDAILAESGRQPELPRQKQHELLARVRQLGVEALTAAEQLEDHVVAAHAWSSSVRRSRGCALTEASHASAPSSETLARAVDDYTHTRTISGWGARLRRHRMEHPPQA
jgi:hypothetical protein